MPPFCEIPLAFWYDIAVSSIDTLYKLLMKRVQLEIIEYVGLVLFPEPHLPVTNHIGSKLRTDQEKGLFKYFAQ